MSARAGLFVAIEGVDGAGKSTLRRRLAAALRAEGRDVVETREPGGAPGAEEIRALLVAGDPQRWTPLAELLLFNAARRDHLDRTIAPALARGAVVLTDRYVDSTRAYQAAGRGVDASVVDALHDLVIGREADLTLIVDIDPNVAAARRAVRAEASAAAATDEERFERFGVAFQTTLRAAFLKIAAARPDTRRVLDGALDEDALTRAALDAIGATPPRDG